MATQLCVSLAAEVVKGVGGVKECQELYSFIRIKRSDEGMNIMGELLTHAVDEHQQ